MGKSRTSWFRQVLEDIKKGGESGQETKSEKKERRHWRLFGHFPAHSVSRTTLRGCRHQIVTQIITSALQSHYNLFSILDGNQNRHTENLVEHRGIFFRNTAHSR
jgi:hypothetical protein